MAKLDDPYVIDYAGRIAKGLRHDGYKNQLGPIAAQLIGSLYGITVKGESTTIKDLSLFIASKLI